MTIAEWCVFGTLMLYLLTIASVKWAGHRHFDNARPRDPAFYEDAIRARALGAALSLDPSGGVRLSVPARPRTAPVPTTTARPAEIEAVP